MLNVGEVKTTISNKLLNNLRQLNQVVVTTAFAEKLGTMVVEESKKMIRAGISPVKGVGRFVGYKDPEKYPGTRKPARPVNLTLTGEMVDSLSFRKEGNVIT